MTDKALDSLLDDSPNIVSLLANASSFIYNFLPNVSWVGFYILEGDKLTLGPFQGPPACTVIPLNKGICGECARDKETVVVKNVHDIPYHIACDSSSLSEIVTCIYQGEDLFGVLDIDSYQLARFSDEDVAIIEKFAGVISKQLMNFK